MKNFLLIALIWILLWLRTLLPDHFSNIEKNNPSSQLWPLLSIISNHQNFCQTKQSTCISLPYQEILADRYRLQAIQYAGSTRIEPDIFFWLIEKSLTLSPSQPFIYFFGSLLLPFGKWDKKISPENKKKSRDLAITLWKKAIKNTCNTSKISTIKTIPLQSLSSIKNNVLLQNPCLRYQNANLLGFHYSYFFENITSAIENYTIASAHTNIPLLLLDLPTKLAEKQVEEAKKN